MHYSRLHPPEQRDHCRKLFADHRGEAGLAECEIQRPDGTRIPVEIAGAPLQLGERRVVQGHFRDISARRAAEEAAREQKTLESTLVAMQRVLGVVGHELRTPLAAMRATSELLLDLQLVKTPQAAAFLRTIHDESVRMAQLVNNLLEAARLNSGVARWDWDTVPLAEACREAASVSGSLIDPQAVRVLIEVDPPDLSMRGDDGAIRRLLINLITNAARHTRQGWIRIGARPVNHADPGAPGWIELTVQDTGDGMSEQVIAKLGQAFVLNRGAVGSDYINGAGLGLNICKSIASAHGGSISVSSRPGEGSTFIAKIRRDLAGPRAVDHESAITREAAI
jgi:signal transduction histidine kinase